MDFDRKFDDSDSEVMEEKNFTELPRIFDENGEQSAADSHASAVYQNYTEEEYPSGTFPALGVAYSDYNIRGTASFVPGKNFSANFSANAYNGGQNRQESQTVRPSGYDGRGQVAGENSASNVCDAARSDWGMVDRRHPDRGSNPGFHRQNGGRVADYSYLQSPREETEVPVRRNISPQEIYEQQQLYDKNLQNLPYAEEDFHTNLSRELGVQSACFDPSDYDYNYGGNDYDAEIVPSQPDFTHLREALPVNSLEQAKPYGESGHPVGQETDFDYYPGENYTYQNEEEPFGTKVAAPQMGSYNLQNQFYDTLNFTDIPQRNNHESVEEVLPQVVPYREETFADNPDHVSYLSQEDDAFATDFSRLSTDMRHLDETANGYSLAESERANITQFDVPAENDRRSYRSAQDDKIAKGRDFYEKSEEFYPIKRIETGGSQRNNPVPVEDDFTGGQALDSSDFYDWGAVPTGAGATQKHEYIQPQLRKTRKGLYFLTCMVMLLLIGSGLYLYSGRMGFNFGGKAEPVIVHKDEAIYKVKPQNPVQNNVASQEQSVMEGINNSGGADAAQKTLIDKTETPVEIQKMDERLPFSGQHSQFDQSSVETLIKTAVAQATPVHVVPSVKVNADRKIIYSSAEGEQLLIPGGHAIGGENAVAVMPAAVPVPVSGTAAVVKQDKDKQKVDAANAIVSSSARMAATGLRTKVQPAAAVGREGGFFMQISSQPTREAAEQSMRDAKRHLNSAIAAKLVIISAAIPDKGTYYRVRVPASTRDEATKMCEEYKQAGGRCFVAR